MTGLREHFAETAEAAKHYDVTEVVVRRARRRRVVAQVVGAAAAALVAGSAAVVLTDRPAEGPTAVTVDATRPPTPGRLGWLPDRFDALDPALLPELPAERGVGEGALVYGRDMVDLLLTSDGTSYRVPGEARGLSPDGRWLAYGADGALVLRSLTDGEVWTTADSDVTGWSVDGGQVVLTPHVEPDVRPPGDAEVLRLDDGDNRVVRMVTVPDPDWWRPRGLSRDGDLVLAPFQNFPATSGTAPRPGVTALWTTAPARTLVGPPEDLGFGICFVDPADGTARSVAVLASPVGMGGQDWRGVRSEIYVRPDTGGLLFQPTRNSAPGDLFEVDPDTGGPLHHYLLPPAGATSLRLIGATTDGIILGANDPGEPAGTVGRLEVLDPRTGDRRTVLDLPANADFRMVRGGVSR